MKTSDLADWKKYWKGVLLLIRMGLRFSLLCIGGSISFFICGKILEGAVSLLLSLTVFVYGVALAFPLLKIDEADITVNEVGAVEVIETVRDYPS